TRAAVVGEELLVAEERRDARLATAGEAGAETASRLAARRSVAPGLGEDPVAAEDAGAGPRALLALLALDRFDAGLHLGAHLVGRTELGRNRERHRDLGGHDAVVAEEVAGTPGVERLPREQLAVAVDAGPLGGALDQHVLGGITRGVHELVDDGGA